MKTIKKAKVSEQLVTSADRILKNVYYVFEFELKWKFEFITFPDDHKQLVTAPVLIEAKSPQLAYDRASDVAKSFGSSNYFEYIAVFKGAYSGEPINLESISNFIDGRIDDEMNGAKREAPEVTD